MPQVRLLELKLQGGHRTGPATETTPNGYIQIKYLTVRNYLSGYLTLLFTEGFEGVKVYVKLDAGNGLLFPLVEETFASLRVSALGAGNNSTTEKKAENEGGKEAFHDVWVKEVV
jgi:hypothetical protein